MGLLASSVRGSDGFTGLGSWSHEDMWWQQWDGANSRMMATELVTKPSLEPGASFGTDDVFQVSRSFLARTWKFWCVEGQRGHWLPGSLWPPITHSREREWVAELLCVRRNGLLRWLLWWCNWIWGQLGCFLGACPPVGVNRAGDTQSSWPGRKR